MEKIKPIRLVIVDANPSTREGLRRFLETEADLKVLGEASDGAEAAKLARQLKPDILLTPSENAHTHRRPGTLTRTEHSGQDDAGESGRAGG